MNAHLHPFTDPVVARESPPKQMVSGDGARVTDAEGNVYLDAVSGLWCASLGFNPTRLTQAATEQMAKLGYYHSFMGRTCEVTERLARRLTEKLPTGLNHVFFGTSGSEAVENAVKLARYHQVARGKPKKMRIIARDGAYHGSGHISAALTSMTYCHEGFRLPTSEVIRAGRAHHFADAMPGEAEQNFSARRAEELDAMIRAEGADTIAAFIGEPIMGAGGVLIPPDGYWDAIQVVLREHDILLIADEIITGFGRTGAWFGSETYGLRPDLMTMAKQLTGAMFPLSAVGISESVYGSISEQAHRLGTLGHGVTYGGHPVGAAVALEALAVYEEMDLPHHVSGLGAQLASGLAALSNLPGVGQVRHRGLLGAVEFTRDGAPADDLARAVGLEAERRGVLFRIINNTLAICPPYVCTPDEIAWITQVMGDSILSTDKAGPT